MRSGNEADSFLETLPTSRVRESLITWGTVTGVQHISQAHINSSNE